MRITHFRCRSALLITLIFWLTGCTGIITERFANNLGQAILNQDDPETVRDGAPAYLLLIDSFVLETPDNPRILQTSAELYGTYAAIFVTDKKRAGRLASKAKAQGRHAVCSHYPAVCKAEKKTLEQFQSAIKAFEKDDIDLLFTYGSSWAVWIQTHSDDWNAVADLSRVEAIMKRVAELDPNHQWGRAYLYLGVINSQLPPSLGGQPEKGKAYFEQAIQASKGQDLIAKIEYARTYARLVYDKELHDKLLEEVIKADDKVNGLVLSNTLAKEQARLLLASSAEYFEDF